MKSKQMYVCLQYVLLYVLLYVLQYVLLYVLLYVLTKSWFKLPEEADNGET